MQKTPFFFLADLRVIKPCLVLSCLLPLGFEEGGSATKPPLAAASRRLFAGKGDVSPPDQEKNILQ